MQEAAAPDEILVTLFTKEKPLGQPSAELSLLARQVQDLFPELDMFTHVTEGEVGENEFALHWLADS